MSCYINREWKFFLSLNPSVQEGGCEDAAFSTDTMYALILTDSYLRMRHPAQWPILSHFQAYPWWSSIILMWSSSTPSPYEIVGVAYKGAENLSRSLIILMGYGKQTLIQIGEIRNRIMARIVENVSEIHSYSNPVLCFVEKRFPQATKEFRIIIIRHHANILHFISSNIDEHRS